MPTKTRPKTYLVDVKLGRHTGCVQCNGPAALAYNIGVTMFVLCNQTECLQRSRIQIEARRG